MLIETREEKGVAQTRITVPRIEARIADDLAERIIEAYKPHRAITIDFSNVGFIDSTGMKALMTVLLHCRKTEGVCVLHGVSEDIMNVFVLTRLNKMLPIKQDSGDAMDAALSLMEQNRQRMNVL